MLRRVTSRGKNRVLKSETLNLFQNNRVSSLISLYYFVPPIQIQGPFLYTLLLNCIPSPSICLFPYFRLFTSNCQSLELPIIRTFFRFPLKVRVIGSRLYDKLETAVQHLFISKHMNMWQILLKKC